MQHQDYKRSIGYDFQAVDEAADLGDTVPKVKWLRAEFASATLESASPAEILESYGAWQGWAAEAKGVRACPHHGLHTLHT